MGAQHQPIVGPESAFSVKRAATVRIASICEGSRAPKPWTGSGIYQEEIDSFPDVGLYPHQAHALCIYGFLMFTQRCIQTTTDGNVSSFS